ncbi:hypothetical protein D9M69_529050 [compost metagenome]
MVVGAVWYSPGMLGKAWMRLAKVKPDSKVSNMQTTIMYGGTFVASVVTAYVLAHVTFLSHDFFSNLFLQDALSTAFWLWLGLTAARIFVHDTFEGRRKKLTLLTAGHEFVTIMVMALIIGLLPV